MLEKNSKLLTITTQLFYAISVFWVIFAFIWLFRDSDYRYFYFVNGLVYAMILAFLGFNLAKKKLWAFWISIIILGLNILLTITDQMGWFDFIYLIPAVGLFVLVIMQRKVFKNKDE